MAFIQDDNWLKKFGRVILLGAMDSLTYLKLLKMESHSPCMIYKVGFHVFGFHKVTIHASCTDFCWDLTHVNTVPLAGCLVLLTEDFDSGVLIVIYC